VNRQRAPRRVLVAGVLFGAIVGAACGSSSSSSRTETTSTRGETVTLLTHDAFAYSKPVLAAFTRQTGIKVRVLKSGDAGAMVNQAILTSDHPQADALFGVDNTFLTRAVDAGLFESRDYTGLDALVPAARSVFAAYAHQAVPIDFGDVCLNYDTGWFANHHLAPPATLADLTKAPYKGLAVVENPATSSPGFAFLLATVVRYGDDGWKQYWRDLKANGVLAVDSWSTAYETNFTAGGGKGTRPIVVSYASSPPADIVYADPPKTTSSVGVVLDGCFRQYELAGVLNHAKHAAAAQQLVEFMLSAQFQADMPLQMFVWPARQGVALPKVFQDAAQLAPHPLTIAPGDITKHRDDWIAAWTSIVAG
jgi:thiamine transport system substrate-binding protein